MKRTSLLVLALSFAVACSSANAGRDADAENPDGSPAKPTETETGPTGALQMYDLSVLFPIRSSAVTGANQLKPSSAGARGVLVPYNTFTDAGFDPGPDAPGAGGTSGPGYADLSVVAARIDPCFADLAPTPTSATCDHQLRLVFQMVTDGPPVSTRDAGMHVFYRLTRAELLKLVGDMAALRIANATPEENAARAPLSVHPQMQRQGLDGPMAKGVRELLLAYAGTENLFRMTRFTSSGPTWHFDGVDVAPTGKITHMVVPGVKDTMTQVVFFTGQGDKGLDGTLPPSGIADDLSLLITANARPSATPAAKQAAFDAALRIQDPAEHSPLTVDCASCHVAHGLQKLVGEGELGLSAIGNPNAYVAPKSVAASQVAPAADGLESVLPFNVHMFGYALGVPTVNQRVVNETAAALDLVTRMK